MYVPRAQNKIDNALAKTAQVFYKDLFFVG